VSALYAVAIVLEVVAVRAGGTSDSGEVERAASVTYNGVLPFWLEEGADHVPTMNDGSIVAVPVLQSVGLAAVLLSIGSIFQTLNNNRGNPASLQTLHPVSAEVTMTEVNQLADSSFVASHGGVNYHPVPCSACGIAGVIEAFPKTNGIHSEVWLSVLLGVGYLVKVKIYHVLLWVRGFSKLQLTPIMYSAVGTCQENK
jgi:hypothetical protein